MSLQRRAKDYTDTTQFLWTDTPAAHEVLQAGRKRWFKGWGTRDAEILRHFIDEGYTVLNSAVAAANVNKFLADLHAALADP